MHFSCKKAFRGSSERHCDHSVQVGLLYFDFPQKKSTLNTRKSAFFVISGKLFRWFCGRAIFFIRVFLSPAETATLGFLIHPVLYRVDDANTQFESTYIYLFPTTFSHYFTIGCIFMITRDYESALQNSSLIRLL